MFQLLHHVLQSLFVCLFIFKLKPLRGSMCLQISLFFCGACVWKQTKPQNITAQGEQVYLLFCSISICSAFKTENKLQFWKVLLYNAQW